MLSEDNFWATNSNKNNAEIDQQETRFIETGKSLHRNNPGNFHATFYKIEE